MVNIICKIRFFYIFEEVIFYKWFICGFLGKYRCMIFNGRVREVDGINNFCR